MSKRTKLTIAIIVIGIVVLAGGVYLVQPSFLELGTFSKDSGPVPSPAVGGTLNDPPTVPGTVQQQYASSPKSYNRYIEYCRTSGGRDLFLVRRDQGDFDRQIFYYSTDGELLDSYSAGDYNPPEKPFNTKECKTLRESSRNSGE